MNSKIMGFVPILVVLTFGPLAAQAAEAPEYGWSGKGEFGLVSTSGNTDTRSLNLVLEFIYNTEQWRHRLGAGAIYAEDSGDTTAERFHFGAQSDYKLSQKSYVFGVLRYEQDEFSAFEDQTTLALGYGRHLLDNETHQLKVEGGLGYRTSNLQEIGESENDMIARGLVDWIWQLTPSTELTERLLVETGSDNTFVQNDLGVAVSINARFALKFGFQVRHNTDAPEGLDKTDTLTAANLVYKF